jgi:hypothetical protein
MNIYVFLGRGETCIAFTGNGERHITNTRIVSALLELMNLRSRDNREKIPEGLGSALIP